jgi:hypothetical protein
VSLIPHRFSPSHYEFTVASVQGFLTALMANTQLLGYFLDKGEKSAAGIQAIGVLSNYAVLLQVTSLQGPAYAQLDATCLFTR